MTISTTTSTITFIGNGSTTVFSFPFVADSAADLIVTYTDLNGTASVLSPSQYTLVINAPPVGGLWGIGGSITYPNTGSPPVPIAAGTTLTVTRAVPYEQLVSINNQGAFYPQVVEQGMDLLELQIQQLATDAAYAIRAPLTDLVPPSVLPSAPDRANGYLAFNVDGQPIVLFGNVPQPIPITAALPRRVSVATPQTVNLTSSDNFGGISIYQSGSAVTTVQLPATQGPYPIFDGSGNASTFPIKVLPPVGLTINGRAYLMMAWDGESITFFNDNQTILAN